MKLPSPLLRGSLVKRYKRFLADIELESGELITAHCANPGSMMGLKDPGMPCWVSKSDNPKRKLQYSLELLEADGALVGINTNNPNRIAFEAIEQDRIEALTGYETQRREVKYGENSRIDILLESTDRPPCYVEIKNCHLMRTPGLAEFPDSVTSRGAKHLQELANQVKLGNRAVMLFVIQRPDCYQFDTAGDIDPKYHDGLRQAAAAGVEVLCYACDLSLEDITLSEPRPWIGAPKGDLESQEVR